MRCSAVIPEDAKIAFVGEAPGAEEEKQGTPFVGASGKELRKMANEAGILISECILSNVVMERPPANRFAHFCGTKRSTGSTLPSLGRVGNITSAYLKTEYEGELKRLREELSQPSLNLVVACGNTATWALLGRKPAVGRMRGYIFPSTLIRGLKVLPVYHPAAILRQWPWRFTTVLDFMRAKREAEYPDIRYPSRTVYVQPETPQEIWECFHKMRRQGTLSVDIETTPKIKPWGPYKLKRQIDCISFSFTPEESLVVPFLDDKFQAYWKTEEEEYEAWQFVRHAVEEWPTLFQWGFYDVYVLYMLMGIKAKHWCQDTTIRQHALYPELPKKLEYLASMHTNEQPWKLRRAVQQDKKEG